MLIPYFINHPCLNFFFYFNPFRPFSVAELVLFMQKRTYFGVCETSNGFRKTEASSSIE